MFSAIGSITHKYIPDSQFKLKSAVNSLRSPLPKIDLIAGIALIIIGIIANGSSLPLSGSPFLIAGYVQIGSIALVKAIVPCIKKLSKMTTTDIQDMPQLILGAVKPPRKETNID